MSRRDGRSTAPATRAAGGLGALALRPEDDGHLGPTTLTVRRD